MRRARTSLRDSSVSPWVLSRPLFLPLPACGRAVPGMIHYAAAHARQIQREPDTFWLSRLRKGPGMQYVNSIFGELLKPIDRRQFREIVERHNGNAYDKTFKSWEHLVTM